MMASPPTTLTVKVHPVVYMAIVDAYERKSSSNIGKTISTAGISAQKQERMESRALGTLLGFYEKNAVQVTNCYAIPFRETGTETPEINDIFNRSMLLMSKRSSPTEQIVGWFFTVSDLPNTCPYYHAYYTQLMAAEATKKELPPVILLTMDMTFAKNPNRLVVNAFTTRDESVPGKDQQVKQVFHPLNMEMDAFPGEAVALNFISRGIDSKSREVKFTNGQAQLLENTTEMVEWLKRMLVYVQSVVAGKEKGDPDVGRKLLEMVNLANTQLSASKLEGLAKHSLRDYLMVSLLANLTKTQLALQEKITSI